MAQERIVRITLLEPYTHAADGVVRISGGQVNALDSIGTRVAIDPTDPAFQAPFNKDENVLTYGRRAAPIEEIDLHETVIYDISMKPGQESTLVPIGAAKIYFGDWELKPAHKSSINPRWTYESERMRVAQQWGGFELMPFNKISPKGDPMADTRRIAPPKVPHVAIQEVDQRGNPIGDVIDPWMFYRWNELVDTKAAAEAARRMADSGYAAANGGYMPQAQPAMPDPSELQKLIDAEVKRQLAAAHKKGVAGG